MKKNPDSLTIITKEHPTQIVLNVMSSERNINNVSEATIRVSQTH